MLLLIIPIAWLLVMLLLVAMCRMAARGDAAPPPVAEAHFRTLRWPVAGLPHGSLNELAFAVPDQRTRTLTARASTGRGARFAAGS